MSPSSPRTPRRSSKKRGTLFGPCGPTFAPATDAYGPLYRDRKCVLCGKECPHGIARENHARKHQREGTAGIRGSGGPSGRSYFVMPVKP